MITLDPVTVSNTSVALTSGDVTYSVVHRWNARDASWYLDVFDEDARPIACGLRVVLGAYLGGRIDHPLFRDGVLVAIDTSGAGREAAIDDLGTRVQLRYYEIREATLLRAGAPSSVLP